MHKQHAQAPPPGSEEAHAAPANVSPEENNKRTDCGAAAANGASGHHGGIEAERERVAMVDAAIRTLVARFALAGWSAHVIGPNRMILSRWGHTRELSVAEAETLLAELSGGTP